MRARSAEPPTFGVRNPRGRVYESGRGTMFPSTGNNAARRHAIAAANGAYLSVSCHFTAALSQTRVSLKNATTNLPTRVFAPPRSPSAPCSPAIARVRRDAAAAFSPPARKREQRHDILYLSRPLSSLPPPPLPPPPRRPRVAAQTANT